ncbi:arsenate reductase [Spectribacter hydrogenoxidans]|uniref:Arsenate reductase n=1 Tax=Spectribacter hydrogenoxidans TaxID=3075608 RepID=A0ABU3C1H2_9GAMM|nr:arsenate reductase [Salinisphaera sp. W335]MDT0635395.1 arsenate reductase [Salinisphaera sp. W335]
MSVILYGLKNCDTTRKAGQWLATAGIDHAFVDLHDDGITAEQLGGWLEALGWEALLNKRSTTWRELPDTDKQAIDAQRARKLLQRHPTLIKRPVLEHGSDLLVGFSAARYEAALAGAD